MTHSTRRGPLCGNRAKSSSRLLFRSRKARPKGPRWRLSSASGPEEARAWRGGGPAARQARCWAGINQSGGQCGRARGSVVAAADERLAMPIEGWIEHWKLAQFLYDWQTLIAGVLAVLAAWGTIRATVESANREIKASQEQTAVAK
jgi:hypothetical protein